MLGDLVNFETVKFDYFRIRHLSHSSVNVKSVRLEITLSFAIPDYSYRIRIN